jgi:uncharacterized membrane protein YbhN (UPF0104 family)
LFIVSILVSVAALGLILSGATAQLLPMLAALGSLRLGTIGTALALSALSVLLSGTVWWHLILRLGYHMPYRAALVAYLNAGLAGYVVNLAGPILGCAMSLRRHGVSPGRAVLLTLIANVLGFCGVLVWAPLGLLLLSQGGVNAALPILGRYGPAAVAGALLALMVTILLVLCALAATTGPGQHLGRRLCIRAHPAEEGTAPTLRYRHVLTLIPYSALSWIVGALALYVVLAGMSQGTNPGLGRVIGAAVLATALGSLAFFAPEGVGVKDGALAALLTHATGLPLTTVVAARLAARALDPLTKLGLLGVLALTTNGAVVGVLARVAILLVRARGNALGQGSRAVLRSRQVVLASAGPLALVSMLFGYSAFAHADVDLGSTPGLAPFVLVQERSVIVPYHGWLIPHWSG